MLRWGVLKSCMCECWRCACVCLCSTLINCHYTISIKKKETSVRTCLVFCSPEAPTKVASSSEHTYPPPPTIMYMHHPPTCVLPSLCLSLEKNFLNCVKYSIKQKAFCMQLQTKKKKEKLSVAAIEAAAELRVPQISCHS